MDWGEPCACSPVFREVRYGPQIDLERVGVVGLSGGGYAAALAALRHGDVFKVAVAASGNYDLSLFLGAWGEGYHGRFDPELYRAQAVKTCALGLSRTKLMLIQPPGHHHSWMGRCHAGTACDGHRRPAHVAQAGRQRRTRRAYRNSYA